MLKEVLGMDVGKNRKVEKLHRCSGGRGELWGSWNVKREAGAVRSQLGGAAEYLNVDAEVFRARLPVITCSTFTLFFILTNRTSIFSEHYYVHLKL